MVQRPVGFLFVDRLVTEKSVDVLAEAHEKYRRSTPTPWPLVVSGDGPLRHCLEEVPGVHLVGFVQPRDLPTVLNGSRAFVLPSLLDFL